MMKPNVPFPPRGGRARDGGERSGEPTVADVRRAQRLRQTSTVAERLLWAELRKLKANFRRQVPIGPYVADFAHLASKLVIEIDGYHHTTPEGVAKDEARDASLESVGYRVLRISESLVRNDLFAVVERIAAEASPPSPTLPPQGGKGEEGRTL